MQCFSNLLNAYFICSETKVKYQLLYEKIVTFILNGYYEFMTVTHLFTFKCKVMIQLT